MNRGGYTQDTQEQLLQEATASPRVLGPSVVKASVPDYAHIRKPNALIAASKQDTPITTNCWAALSSSFGQSDGGLKPLHNLVFQETDILAAMAESILTWQGSGVGVGVDEASTRHLSPPLHFTCSGIRRVL